jgi:DNA repair protein RecO (recombination protein O)
VAEVLDDLLPDREANDAIFRLAVATLAHLDGDAIWMPLTYFQLWLTRLVGFLPDLGECVRCGTPLEGRKAYFHASADGLLCSEHKRMASSELTPESRRIAAEMFRAPIPKFAGISWPKAVAADLRKLLVQTLERHLDKELNTAAMLDKLPG